MQVIDTNNIDLIEELENLKNELDKKLKDKNGYELSDFALVRATNHLPQDHILKALCRVPFVMNINCVARGAIHNIFREKYSVNVYDEDEYEKFRVLINKYSPLSTQYRSTIHLTLNGLVASHSKGNFDNRNFIVIDELSKHLGIDDFRSIRMEDSFVFGEFPISDDAIILIAENKYETLLKENPWLETYKNIILYRGTPKIATEIILSKMGIIPENIQTDYAEYTERTPLQHDYFGKIKEIFGIEEMKHWLSPEYAEDDEKNEKLWKIYDLKFYNDLFEHFELDESRKQAMIEFLISDSNNRKNKVDLLKKYIMEIGVENYQQFILNYNENILTEIKNNNYPTNDEILESNSIILKNDSLSNKK